MKVFIHEMVDDSFVNQDTGEVIEYSNCLVYEDEHNNSENRKGRRIIKVKTTKGLINSVDASNMPGWFDAEIGIGNAGKLKFTKLTPITKETK